MEREISIILKIKGAKEAKKALNDVFDGQTKTLVDGFNKSTKKTGDNMKRVDRHSKSAGKSMDGFTKILGRGMAALYLYNRAWSTFGRNFEMGLNLERAADQFERHVGKVAEMLPTLRSATRGIISDFDLLKTANRAFQQGIQPQQMGKAFSLATSAAQKLGLNASEAIRTITDAITTQNEGALKTLGVITNVNQAYQTQTALIAKNGGVMSKAMQIQLRQSLIMQELQRRFGGANAAQEDGLMILERFRASWKNFRAAIGDTLGLALRPLTRALTSVLDVTTALLNKLNDTSGFKKFVQLSATLAGIWAGVKFIGGAKTLLQLFGFISGRSSLVRVTRMGKAVRFLLNSFKLGFRLAKWPLMLASLVIDFDKLKLAMSTAYNMGNVLFQLLSNYDPNTGLSKVLKSDAESLGKYYNAVENGAKKVLKLYHIVKGFSEGVMQALSPLGSWISAAVSPLVGLTDAFFTQAKAAGLVNSELDSLADKYRFLGRVVGPTLLGILGGGLVGGLPGAAIGGLAGAGYSLSTSDEAQAIAKMYAGKASQGADKWMKGAVQNWTGSMQLPNSMNPSDIMNTGLSNWSHALGVPGLLSMNNSTGQSTPEPRGMNLDSMESQTDLLKKNNKLLERQNQLWEKEIQDRDIEKSQNDARSNIWMRR